jgi:hypothetical protein
MVGAFIAGFLKLKNGFSKEAAGMRRCRAGS